MARSGSLLAVLDKPRNVSRCATSGVGPKNGIGMALWIAGFPQGRHREGGGSGGDCGGHQATRDAGDAEQHLRHRRANNAEQAHAAIGDQRPGQHDRQNGAPFPEPQRIRCCRDCRPSACRTVPPAGKSGKNWARKRAVPPMKVMGPVSE